jgi:hypothetical protein
MGCLSQTNPDGLKMLSGFGKDASMVQKYLVKYSCMQQIPWQIL